MFEGGVCRGCEHDGGEHNWVSAACSNCGGGRSCRTCDAAGMPTWAYRVEVKSRAAGSLAFRWEIYLGATTKPAAASFSLFRTAQQAQEAGERALAKLVAERDADTERE
jgi:hypothetical protein